MERIVEKFENTQANSSSSSNAPDSKQTLRKIYAQPAFLICIVLLAIAGSGMSLAIKNFGVILEKEPLPIKKALELLDENDLSPYKVKSKGKITSKEMIKALGTEEYIQWFLEDTEADDNSPFHSCLIFITYYKLADRVPHVPEECYTGGGYQKMTSDSMTLEVNRSIINTQIPARQLVFASTKSNYWQADTRFSVFYLFNVNKKYANTRGQARTILNENIFGKSSYFCKIEWSFLKKSGMRTNPDGEQAIAASQKLLNVILPILEKEHWPDWEESTKKQE